jgi:hypothetical protein
MCDGFRVRGQANNNYEREIGKEYPTKDKDVKVPEKTVGGVRVQVPKPTLKTDDTFENGTNRKDNQQRLDNARRPDARDQDPKVHEREKRNKTEGSAREFVQPQMKDGMDEATGKKAEDKERRDQMMKQINDGIRGVPKQKHMPKFN